MCSGKGRQRSGKNENTKARTLFHGSTRQHHQGSPIHNLVQTHCNPPLPSSCSSAAPPQRLPSAPLSALLSPDHLRSLRAEVRSQWLHRAAPRTPTGHTTNTCAASNSDPKVGEKSSQLQPLDGECDLEGQDGYEETELTGGLRRHQGHARPYASRW